MAEQKVNKLGKLSDEQIDMVSGGYITERNGRYYIFFDDGLGIIARNFPSYESAASYAKKCNTGTEFKTLDELETIFGMRPDFPDFGRDEDLG